MSWWHKEPRARATNAKGFLSISFEDKPWLWLADIKISASHIPDYLSFNTGSLVDNADFNKEKNMFGQSIYLNIYNQWLQVCVDHCDRISIHVIHPIVPGIWV